MRHFDRERRTTRFRITSTPTQRDTTGRNYREVLDRMRLEDVRWMPFGEDILQERFHASTYQGTIRFTDVVEPYMPDRDLRQFGSKKSRPLNVITPTTTQRPTKLAEINCQYRLVFEDSWNCWAERYRCQYIIGSPVASWPWDVHEDYLDWYLQVSHPCVLESAEIQESIVLIVSSRLDEHKLALSRELVDAVYAIGSPTLDDISRIREILRGVGIQRSSP